VFRLRVILSQPPLNPVLAAPVNPWLIVCDRAWHRMRKGNCSMSFLVELDRGAYVDDALHELAVGE